MPWTPQRSRPSADPTSSADREADLDVLMLLTSDAMGGMQRVILSLVKSLQQDGLRVACLAPTSGQGHQLQEQARLEGVAVQSHAAVLDAAARHTFRSMLALRRLVKERRPEIVNIHYGDVFISLKDVIALRLAGRGCRLIAGVHNNTSWSEAGWRKRFLTGMAGRLLDLVLVNSDATYQLMLEAGIPKSKVRKLRLGVAHPTWTSREEARTLLGLPASAFVVASLARLVPHKGISDLVQAVGRCPIDDVLLVVGGDGPELDRLVSEARSLLGERALVLGHLAEPGVLLAAADVFVLPSRIEGFGLVYIEAAMHGVPSVGCAVGGVPEAIADGVTGLLVPPGDVDALRDAIVNLRTHPEWRARLGATARTRALTEFTDHRMYQCYRALIK
jgi:glycosyltransferase involved in cell wall biosynthesis